MFEAGLDEVEEDDEGDEVDPEVGGHDLGRAGEAVVA